MNFYSELAKYYDLVFPFEKTIGSFLRRHMPEGGSDQVNLLDIACGTGIYTAYLAEDNIRIVGLDADEEMIAEAVMKFKKRDVEFITGDMLNLQKVLGEKKFNGIYCIGNSVVHLENEKEIELFLDQCRSILIPGGILIIQIINFDRILEQNIRSLPTLDDREVEFKRNYRPLDNDHVSFDTEITIKRNGKSFTNSIPLIPLKKNKLIKILENTGFEVIDTFGSYSEEGWEEGSFLTIIRAQIPLNRKIP